VPEYGRNDELVDVTPDHKKIVVASNVRVREVDRETRAVRDLLQGPWLTHVRCLAEGFVAVLGREGTHRLERSDPDVAAMKSVADMPAHLTWFEVQTPGMLFVLDLRARPEKILVQSIACRAERIDAVLDGRVLVVGHGDGTTFYGVKHRQLALMGKLEEKLGRVFDVGKRVYGEGFEIEGIEEAWGAARVEEKKHAELAVEGDFSFEPAESIPSPSDVPVHAHALVGPGGWHADRRFGGQVFALVADPKGYACAIVDESKEEPVLRKIDPPIAGSSFKYDLSFDGKHCVVSMHDAVWDVDSSTGKAKRVATTREMFVTATLLGDLLCAIHRVGIDGELWIWKRTDAGVEKIHSISCGKYDSLFMLAAGDVVMIASEYAPTKTRLRAHFIGARNGDVRYLGRVYAPFKHATSVDGASYVEDAEGCVYEIKELDFAMDRAFARPENGLEISLSDEEQLEPPQRDGL
jgi:hypothetical protein